MKNPFTEVKESAIVEAIRRRVEKNFGGVWYKVHGGPYQEAGIPDIIGCLNGYFIAFEVKRPDKRHNTSPQQKYQITRLGNNNALVAVVTSPDEAENFLEAYRGALF